MLREAVPVLDMCRTPSGSSVELRIPSAALRFSEFGERQAVKRLAINAPVILWQELGTCLHLPALNRQRTYTQRLV